MRQANILPEVLSEAEQATGLMKLEKEQAAQAASARQQRFEDELAVLSAAVAKATSSQAARQEQAKILELAERYNSDYPIDTAKPKPTTTSQNSKPKNFWPKLTPRSKPKTPMTTH